MNSTNDTIDCDVHQMWRIQGTSWCVFTNICKKLHEIACYLTRLSHQTHPAGCVTPHIYGLKHSPEVVNSQQQARDKAVHWQIYIQNFLVHTPPWDPILSFSHTFTPKSTHIGGPCPPPPREILDPPLQ